MRFGGEGAGGLAAGRGAQHAVAGPVEDGGDGVERGRLAGAGDADHHADRGATATHLFDGLALPEGERATEVLLALVDRQGDLFRVDHGPGSTGERFDDAGDGGFSGEDLDGGVGLLPGVSDTDERHDRPAGDDVLEDTVEFGGISSIEARGELGD